MPTNSVGRLHFPSRSKITSPLKMVTDVTENPGTTPFMLFALLLLPALPLVFTFMKLLELPTFGERSHQLVATNQPPNGEQFKTQPEIIYHYVNLEKRPLSDFLNPFNSFISVFKSFDISSIVSFE